MVQSQMQLTMIGKPAAKESPSESETREYSGPSTESESESAIFQPKSIIWWAQIFLYSFLVLAGQAVGVLLGRLYFNKGGNSKWISSVVQCVGFPAFLPFYSFLPKNKPKTQNQPNMALKLGAIYIILGLLVALDIYLYTIGLMYLPVSTYSLICASQLAFNALFAFLLNKHKFTPYIINSIVILTISCTLLVFQNQPSSSSSTTQVTKQKYIIGFTCTVAASALFGLILPLTQLAFDKVIKGHGFRSILDMLVYQNLVATAATVVGLFVSGEWATLRGEMEVYRLGRVSYVMTLVWIALAWQIFAMGALMLITQVSSLFSNVISTLGLPIVPVLAVVIFRDEMDGIKAVAMVLAIWGFVSYAYQCYIDHTEDIDSRPKQVEVATA